MVQTRTARSSTTFHANFLLVIPELELSKTRVTEPIIKGRDYKPREKRQDAQREISPEKEKGKIKRDSTKLEAAYDD